MSYARIRPRRGTAYEWSTVNPLLEEGELGIEFPDNGIGTGFCKFKLGNGVDRWNDLAYAFDGTTASSINGGNVEDFHVIQIRSGESSLWEEIDPVLNKNELIYVSDKRAFKVGDGVNPFTALPYTCSASLVDDEFDFGDETDPDVIYSNEYNRAVDEVGRLDYPDSITDIPVLNAPAPEVSEPTAELKDLFTVDPGSVIKEDKPVEIESGEIDFV